MSFPRHQHFALDPLQLASHGIKLEKVNSPNQNKLFRRVFIVQVIVYFLLRVSGMDVKETSLSNQTKMHPVSLLILTVCWSDTVTKLLTMQPTA